MARASFDKLRGARSNLPAAVTCNRVDSTQGSDQRLLTFGDAEIPGVRGPHLTPLRSSPHARRHGERLREC